MIKVAHRTFDNLYCRCPFGKHKDENPSLRIALTGQYAGTFKCFGCGKTGYAHELGIQIEAKPSGTSCQKKKKVVDWNTLQDKYWHRGYAELNRAFLASDWKVSINIMYHLGVGWDDEAWTFPMRNELYQIIGIQKRYLNGRKICMNGSKLGLFIPNQPLQSDALLITEGVSDTAVALNLGFAAIGRPSCNTGSRLIARWLQKHNIWYEKRKLWRSKWKKIVIVSDNGNDNEREGAIKLRNYLTKHWKIDMIIPEAKDLRQWVAEKGKDCIKQKLLEISK